jgi:beta-lactamase superfamily II metal-dependent hydrolase
MILALAWLVGCRGVPAQGPRPANQLRVDFFDVGQGDSALIRSASGKTVLIDGGPREAGARVDATLNERGIRTLDLVLLTHRHLDHLGGLRTVLERHGTRMFLDAPYPHDIPEYGRLLAELDRQHVLVRQAEYGRNIDLGGGAILSLLGPPQPTLTGTRSDVNANGIVSRLDCGKLSILFAADSQTQSERWLVETQAQLRAAILKVSHHGSRTGSTSKFLQVVQPWLAIISVGTGNEYGHPDPQTVERLQRSGARVLRTDRDGPIAIESDCQTIHLVVRGHKEVLRAP